MPEPPPPNATPGHLESLGTAEQWLEDHGDLLYKYAVLRVRDPHVAEDLVQETLIKAMTGIDKFRGEASLRTWLFAILRNEVARHFRGQKKTRLQSDVADEESGMGMEQLLSPEMNSQEFGTAVERDEFWAAIQLCFERVPEHLLDTFLFRLANPDEKIENLCQTIDLKPSNFSVRLFRTRLMLRECLERSWMKGDTG